MEPTKRCTKCSETLPIGEFYKQARGMFGVRGDCKSCKAGLIKARLATPKGAKLRRKALRRHSKTDKRKAVQAAMQRRRKSLQAQATPPWAPLHVIASYYAEAERLTFETGVVHQVHHIMPIMEFGALFVGLHVPWNLEVLSAEEHSQAHVQLRQEYGRAAALAKKMML